MRPLLALVCALAMCSIGVGLGDAATMNQAQHSPRFVVASKLARGLRSLCADGSGGCPLVGQAWVIEDVGWHERLSPAFMVGASFTESSGGASPCCGQALDIWGWYYAPHFNDWRDAFTKYARFIHSRWPGARTPYDLQGYCGCGSTAWGNATSGWMARLGFGGGRLAYP